MSSRQYTVTVKLKDDGLLKKLEGVGSSGGGGKSGGGTSGVFAGGNDIFRRIETLGMGQLLKLTGIGIGVGSLVALTIKSSGMLQGTFRLWENAISLIFKPFGDFIAMAFRPWVVLMMQLAIPFYKVAHKWFQEFTKNGKAYELDPYKAPPERLDAQFLRATDDFGRALTAWGSEIEFRRKIFIEDLGKNLSAIPGGIMTTYATFNTALGTALTSIPPDIVDRFTELGTFLTNSFTYISKVFTDTFFNTATSLWNAFTYIPKVFTDTFFTLGTNIWNGLLSVPGAIVDVFTGLVDGIASALSGIPSAIYNAIMGWVSQLSGGLIGGGGGGIQTTGTTGGLSSGSTRTRTTMAGMADTARA